MATVLNTQREGVTVDVLAAQAGDQQAFVRLVRRHDRLLSGRLARFTSDTSSLQDLRQETWLEVYRSLRTFSHRGPFSAWLMQIATRVGYRYWACRSKEALARLAYVESCSQGPHAPRGEDQEAVAVLLEKVKPADKALLEMRYLQQLKAQEIALRLGWKVPRVRVRLHRAIKSLRQRCTEADVQKS